MNEQRKETIGECELCGLVDHHLVEGVCANCVRKYELDKPDHNLPRKQSSGRLVALDAKFPSKR